VIGRAAIAYDIAGVLVPAKRQPAFGALHHELIEEKVGILAQERAADVRHDRAEQHGAQCRLSPLALVGEVTAAPMGDADTVDAQGIHAAVLTRYERIALLPEHFEHWRSQHAREYGVTFRSKMLSLGFEVARRRPYAAPLGPAFAGQNGC
jgi:hypothetical protein